MQGAITRGMTVVLCLSLSLAVYLSLSLSRAHSLALTRQVDPRSMATEPDRRIAPANATVLLSVNAEALKTVPPLHNIASYRGIP